MDHDLLARIIGGFATGETPPDQLADLVSDLITDPATAVDATSHVIFYTVVLARAGGLLPDVPEGSEVFFGLQVVARDPSLLDSPLELARKATMQAFTAALNNDDQLVAELLAPTALAGLAPAVCAFHTALVLFRDAANTPGGLAALADGIM